MTSVNLKKTNIQESLLSENENFFMFFSALKNIIQG